MSEPLAVRLIEFKAKRHGTFRGWAKVALPFGMILPGCPVHVHGRRAVAFPPMRLLIDTEGKLARSPAGKAVERSTIEFSSSERKAEFASAVGAAVAAAYPEILQRRR